ncbi:MAG TPA: cell wall anchor protein, partial [Candidatus Saccharibacteria bacterium]|nr:cell wall anchor protein [Candidatus Saccharibacteria bacterium]
PMVAGATGHALALSSSGQVYAWGENTYGHLGNGTTDSSLVPIPVTSGDLDGKTITEVAAAANHSLALDIDGQVYAWGNNGSGRLGDGTITTRLSPVAITGGALSGKTIVAIEAGSSHSLALDSDGQVYAWGRNLYGQIGDGTSSDRHSPVAITGGAIAGKTITKIAASGELSFVIDSDGLLYGWGRNYYGALGVSGANSGNTPNPSPGAVNGSAGLAGKVVSSVVSSPNIMASFAIDSTGVLYAWGNGAYNSQLGTGVNGYVGSPTPVTVGDLAGKTVAMAAGGGAHSLALDSSGAVYAWGGNDYGELGISGGKTGTAKLVSTGDLAGKAVVFISAGHSFSLAITSEGQVVAWGRNYAGQLGDGTIANRTTPAIISGLDLN